MMQAASSLVGEGRGSGIGKDAVKNQLAHMQKLRFQAVTLLQ
jgi:hypothetical protein